MLDDGGAEERLELGVEVLLWAERGDAVAEVVEGLGDDGVECGVDLGAGLAGAGHPEFEFVSGEGEGRGAVAVGGVSREDGEGVDADAELAGLA